MKHERVMVSLRKSEMQEISKRAKDADRSKSYIIRQICIGEEPVITEAPRYE